MRVLVTGANGLLGREVVRQLVLQGNEPILGVSQRRPGVEAGLDQVVLNVSEGSFERTLPARLDSIIHLAQSRKFKEFPKFAGDVFKSNVWLTQSLLQHAEKNGVERFVLASSGSVYRTKKSGWLHEKSPLVRPGEGGHYAASKLSAELISQAYSHLLDVQVLRFFYIYGPGQNRQMLIPRLVERVRAQETVSLEGRQGLRFNPIYVTDAAQAVLAAQGLKGSHCLNIAGPVAISLRQVVETVGHLLGRPVSVRSSGTRSPRVLASTVRMQALVGSSSRLPRFGLQKMVEADTADGV